MAHELYELLVKKINRETEDCVTVELEVPAALKELFLFTQGQYLTCLLYTSPSPRDRTRSRMPSSA